MPPQLPYPGQASRAMRFLSAASGSPAAWKPVMMSIGCPVSESLPGRIGPSDMMIAGRSCSSTPASVPTGGLSQATTAMTPSSPLALRCSQTVSCVTSRPISE